MKYHKLSIIATVVGLILAFIWGERVVPGSGPAVLFITCVLAILEVSLSFDNAVVNAVKLKTMSEVWRKRFLTWGMFIAVFGTRFVFPVLIVSVFSGVGLVEVMFLALKNPEKYAYYLHKSHASIAAFGGIFLLMLFLSFVFNQAKKIHWIKIIEEKLASVGKLEGVEVIIALSALYITQAFVATPDKLAVVLAGIGGLVIYLAIDGLARLLEAESESGKSLSNSVKQGGLMTFLYLEIIDASFSFDGVMGAFAISTDIIIISIGLTIGAMFVRSITIMLVEKNTLQKYIYLEHGAHWAIGTLAVIMLYTTFGHVSEVITGLIGMLFIGASYLSSISLRKVSANSDK